MHDIGKNIVGVVLQCNEWDVVDLGVMVPAAKILETAKAENVDLVGLSGLITPSLDEMAFVATEFERTGSTIPLLIGGATTSKAHTALRIAPGYSQPVVHVLDASRAVPVASALRDPVRRIEMAAQISTEYAKIRAEREGEHEGSLVPIAEARAHHLRIDLAIPVPQPSFIGLRTFDAWPLADLRARIDWTPFFQTWEMQGAYPAIFESPVNGQAARDLFRDAEKVLDELERSGALTAARRRWASWPADACGDDIMLYNTAERDTPLAVLHITPAAGRPQGWARGDRAGRLRGAARRADHRLCRRVRRDRGSRTPENALALKAKAEQDDYRAILLSALADRLAEAFAERLHEMVRREYWGYAPDERLENDDLVHERYQGIRPAPGYPACPDHTEKATLASLLNREESTGITLTESFAMWPGASVSGWYFWRPDARYFGVGRVGRDQVEDYARRKGWDVAMAERWLSPVLGYRRR